MGGNTQRLVITPNDGEGEPENLPLPRPAIKDGKPRGLSCAPGASKIAAIMSSPTFRDFLSQLEREGELARVKAQVSPLLEISQIADRVSKTPAPRGHKELDRSPAAQLGGKALLF